MGGSAEAEKRRRKNTLKRKVGGRSLLYQYEERQHVHLTQTRQDETLELNRLRDLEPVYRGGC